MSINTIPSRQKALIINDAGNGYTHATSHPIPELINDNEILVNIDAVALNPTDWKHAYGVFDLKPGSSAGSDFSGVIVKLPNDVSSDGTWRLNDRVAGFTRGGHVRKDNGAFAEYIAAQKQTLWKVPSNITPKQAAAFGGISADTAAQALYSRLKVTGLWEETERDDALLKKGDPILIWSGAASVSFYAIQLAKLAGLVVYTTASPHNHAALKAIGADYVYDYKQPNVSELIQKDSSDKLRYALDGISEWGSIEASVQSLSSTEEGIVVTLLPEDKDSIAKLGKTNIKVVPTLVYSVLSGPGSEPIGNAQDAEDIAKFHGVVTDLLESGKIKVATLDERQGGLEKIEEGLADLKNGKVSGKKIVYLIQNKNEQNSFDARARFGG